MNIKFCISGGLVMGSLVLLGAGSVFGQQKQPPPAPDHEIVFERAIQGPETGGVAAPSGDTFFFMASEMSFDGKLIKGAPYSAQAVTETTQTLGDGNRIVNKLSSAIYRDSEGRTRREQTLKAIGPFANAGEPLQTIFISDPVAGVCYALDSRTHVAHKNQPFHMEHGLMAGPPPGGPNPAAVGQQAGILRLRTSETVSTEGPGPQIAVTKLRTQLPGGDVQFGYKGEFSSSNNAVKESLGKQTIEGVEAEGTRTTITIPAGEIGNERAIEIVDERWYSDQLQTMVMTRHSDPRAGEMVYRLTNISRNEPDHSLFEVPADYSIKEGPVLNNLRVRKPGTEQ